MIFTNKPSEYSPTVGEPNTKFFNEHIVLPEDYMLKEIYTVKTKIGRNDALKLYEMAYYSSSILELGCFQGASTFVIANACRDSGNGKIISVDLSTEALPIAKQLILDHGLSKYVTFINNDAVKQVEEFIDKENFDFVFVDHDHAYESVYKVCLNLDKIVNKGYVFFHDYQDYRNEVIGSGIQVWRAVNDGLHENFKFVGLYGQGGLFKKELVE